MANAEATEEPVEKTARKKSARKKAGEVEYFAGKVLTVGRDGKTVKVGVGEPVPEAASWRNLNGYLRSGAVVGVQDGVPIRLSRKKFHRLGPLTPEMKLAIGEKRRAATRNSMAAVEVARAAGRVVPAGQALGAAGSESDETGGVDPPKTPTVRKKRTRKA